MVFKKRKLCPVDGLFNTVYKEKQALHQDSLGIIVMLIDFENSIEIEFDVVS